MDQLCQYPVIQESTAHVQNFLNQSLTVKQVTIVHLEQRKRNLQMEWQEISVQMGRIVQEEAVHQRIAQLEHS